MMNTKCNLYGSHAWYVPGVKGMFALLGWFLAGTLLAGIGQAIFNRLTPQSIHDYSFFLFEPLTYLPAFIYVYRKSRCNRQTVTGYMPDSRSFVTNVNLWSEGVGTQECPHFRNREKVRMAKGMLHIFNGDMPAKVEPFVRERLIGRHCKTYYYEYRKGARLISPALREEIRSLFREVGWNKEIHFDGYVEDYEW